MTKFQEIFAICIPVQHLQEIIWLESVRLACKKSIHTSLLKWNRLSYMTPFVSMLSNHTLKATNRKQKYGSMYSTFALWLCRWAQQSLQDVCILDYHLGIVGKNNHRGVLLLWSMQFSWLWSAWIAPKAAKSHLAFPKFRTSNCCKC